MLRCNLKELAVFTTIARTRSFTKAAVELGVSQSALSHTMRRLEERLGVRLLARSTRSAAPTDAGERLLQRVEPHLAAIEAGVAVWEGERDQPAGIIRLTAVEHAAVTLLYPAIGRLAAHYPDVKFELSVDNAFVDIVANRFDAGVRLRNEIERDMIAVRIGPDLRMAIVATPSYFKNYSIPLTPEDLTGHNCINLRLPTYGHIVPWEFEKNGQHMTVRTDGQLTFNARINALGAVLDGLGLGCCPEDLVRDHLTHGRLLRVLDEWCQPVPGYHLYYPSRRQPPPVFSLLLKALRYPGDEETPNLEHNTILDAWSLIEPKDNLLFD